MKVTQSIPAEKICQFTEILSATGGRYLSNPFPLWRVVQVHYEPGDYTTQCEAWERCVTPIRETRRDQRWRKVIRRCMPSFVLRHLKV
jgi:hypothetical protein